MAQRVSDLALCLCDAGASRLGLHRAGNTTELADEVEDDSKSRSSQGVSLALEATGRAVRTVSGSRRTRRDEGNALDDVAATERVVLLLNELVRLSGLCQAERVVEEQLVRSDWADSESASPVIARESGTYSSRATQ